jgi:hypothetical protein
MKEKLTLIDQLTAYIKELKKPFYMRPNPICGFFKIGHNLSLIVFEDGLILTMDNEDNKGIVGKNRLKLPFKKATSVLFNFSTQVLMLRNEELKRVFFQIHNG